MPGFLVHEGAIVLCSHGGTAQPTVPYPRVTVSGQPIVLQVAPYAVAGCPNIIGIVPVPCVTGNWLLGSLRIKANGLPVVLRDSLSITVPNATTLQVVNTQVRVQGA